MGRAAAVAYLAAGLLAAAAGLRGPRADFGLGALAILHVLFGGGLLACRQTGPRSKRPGVSLTAEALFALSLLYFVFLYVYALNANIDYVQRFARGSGTLWLAPDTRAQRLDAFVRCAPLLAAGFWGYAVTRWGAGRFSLLAALASAALGCLAQPSFVRVEGIALLGWVSFVPLLLALPRCRTGRAVFTITAYGAFASLAGQYWLGTFSLVSLQVAMLILTAYHLALGLPLAALLRASGRLRWLAFAVAWTAFEWVRSLGFLGFPWTLAAHTQFRHPALLQGASLTGEWGVSFVVLLLNAALAEALAPMLRPHPRLPRPPALRPLAAAALVLLLWGGAGLLALWRQPGQVPGRDVRVALIQQNSDPRRYDYEVTYDALVRLTDEAVARDPGLVVWSETAFVPNIRRWGAEALTADTPAADASFIRLVRRFREYQAGLHKWLVTGNDDYSTTTAADGSEARSEYNAAVLFDDQGARRETYHKVRLVPFTEYFPYRRAFAWIYDLLISYDVTLWEPGRERTIFAFPGFRFAAPICFEDIFPDEIRRFVLAGAEVIVNLSNDYWSLTPVEARQHFAAAVFRAVENRRPLLCATASGVTAAVDSSGRILATLPQYTEGALVTDVRVADDPAATVYTRAGDWFPAACGLAALCWGIAALAAAAARALGQARARRGD